MKVGMVSLFGHNQLFPKPFQPVIILLFHDMWRDYCGNRKITHAPPANEEIGSNSEDIPLILSLMDPVKRRGKIIYAERFYWYEFPPF
jgi:hypothetical protein